MWISLALLLLYGSWAFWVWRTTPPVISEAELASEDFCCAYATTPVRRWSVIIGSCALYAVTLSLINYAIAELIWQELFVGLFNASGALRYFIFACVAAVIVAITRLPKITELINDVCNFFQRCQFFPMLPSIKEESLIEQIAVLPVGTIPSEIEAVLKQGRPPIPDGYKQALSAEYQRLEIIYAILEELARKHNGIVRRFYFGSDWELIESQFYVIDRQMNSNFDDASETLAKNIQTCLFYCYSLFTRVIMETSTSAEESRALFKYYGFDVKVPE